MCKKSKLILHAEIYTCHKEANYSTNLDFQKRYLDLCRYRHSGIAYQMDQGSNGSIIIGQDLIRNVGKLLDRAITLEFS